MSKKKEPHSIIQSEKYCYLCNVFYHQMNYRGLECHHVMNGWGKRTPSDKTGLWVWLCQDCHRLIHKDAEIRIKLKMIGQACYEANGGSRQSFMEKFGKNYL